MAKFESFLKGNTFTGVIYYAPPKSGLPNLIGYTATSKVLDAAGNRHEGVCVVSEDGLSIQVTFSSTITNGWAVGKASWNVRFELNGNVFSTDTTEFEVESTPTTV